MLPLYRQIKQRFLQSHMTDSEASATALMLIEEVTGHSRTQILTADFLETDTDKLLSLADQIANGTPIQYALGYTYFCGMKFQVNPHVLIPRPETEELVEWIYSSFSLLPSSPSTLLDIGTGSGCIAISLAKKLPQIQVTALDISSEALQIAQRNAQSPTVDVAFLQLDILSETPPGTYACIVSNPPYVCESEALQMESNVLDHEPHLALFVPDATPLLFYETIARKALHLLTPNGYLFFEINRQYGSAITTLLHDLGYTDVQLRQDQFGNDRMIRAKMVKSRPPLTPPLWGERNSKW